MDIAFPKALRIYRNPWMVQLMLIKEFVIEEFMKQDFEIFCLKFCREYSGWKSVYKSYSFFWR